MNTEAIVVGTDGGARLEPVELPALTDTRVRVRTRWSGLSCGTEADCASGRATYMRRPFITGYQAVGEVVEIGQAVSGVQAGDRVFTMGGGLWTRANLAGGSHARELIVEQSAAIRLSPSNPSLRTTAYAALGAVALEGLKQMQLAPGRVLVVFGLGMLGQLAGALGRCLGLRVVGVNRSTWKSDAARMLGFDAACPPESAAIEAAVAALAAGPARLAADTTGCQPMFNLALATLGREGELALLGFYPEKFVVDFDLCHAKRLTLHNPVGVGSRVPEVIGWIEQGRLNVEPLIRHTVKPAEVTGFYADLVRNHSRYLGVVIDWEA